MEKPSGRSTLSINRENVCSHTWSSVQWESTTSASLRLHQVTWLKSVSFKKPGTKRRWVDFVIIKQRVQARVPPEAGNTRWNSWFEAVKYHAEYLQLYKESFLAENSSSLAVTNILNLLDTQELDITVQKWKDSYKVKIIEFSQVANWLGVWVDLIEFCKASVWFGTERREERNHLHDAFQLAVTKFSKLWDTHSEVYRLVRVFFLRQAPASHNWNLWHIHRHCIEGGSLTFFGAHWLQDGFEWEISMGCKGSCDLQYIFFSVNSVYSQRTFSKHMTLPTDKHETLTKMLTKMYFNGDISKTWKT